MAITKKPVTKPAPEAVASFIDAAPDGAKIGAMLAEARPRKTRRVPVQLSIDPDLLERFDAVADANGLTRSAAVAVAMQLIIDGGRLA